MARLQLLRHYEILHFVQDDRLGRGACGVSAPRDAVLLFWQKDPKPWAPGRGPLPQSRRFGLRNSLRSDSPRPHKQASGPGRSLAWRRPGFGAMGWRATTTKDEGGRPH